LWMLADDHAKWRRDRNGLGSNHQARADAIAQRICRGRSHRS
jgi:hypothetical protein